MTAATLTAEPTFATDDTRWQAVLNRDARADGLFVLGVRTTGIYCRPSCPARKPKRANVRFYTLNREAEADGLRPCRRCRPTEPSLAQRHVEAVEAVCRRLEAATGALPLADLAAEVGLSRYHLHRLFKAQTGVTPKAYHRAIRAARLRDGIGHSASVTASLHAAGYGSASRFYHEAKATLGMAPAVAQKGGAGQTIRYAIAPSTLGQVLVAYSARGLCAVRFGDSTAELQADLRARFPHALCERAELWDDTVCAVIARIEQPDSDLDLPLDIQGTVFQHKVWTALRAIPLGQTASYAEIAAHIGAPRAVRAVAQACGANPVAVVVPCHRVVRNDGTLSGYRWGTARKAELLKREQHKDAPDLFDDSDNLDQR